MSDPFYGRSFEERVALTDAAIRERRTLIERWANLTAQESSGWNARAAMAAAWLADVDSVVDFGAGSMTLESYIRPEQSYIPVDVVARDARTIVSDFNAALPPPVNAEAAACLGLLEYLFDPARFLRHIREHHAVAVISYCATDRPGAPEQRREHAWVNAFSSVDMRQMFATTGFRIVDEQPVDDLQMLWRLNAN